MAGYAVSSHQTYIYLRGEYEHQANVLRAALEQAKAAGYVGDNIAGSGYACNVTIYLGAGAYICGEETALLESLEGKRGQPRLKPPFPAVAGLYHSPTLINNVETLAALPPIIENGGDWYAAIGPEKSPGSKLFSISGHVMKPARPPFGNSSSTSPAGFARDAASRRAGSADRACRS
jgi:NADH-quinone oxidoreductase subunit F